MKKSLLALAVLGAFAGAASAQSSVTMYGRVDLSIGKPLGVVNKGMFNGSGSRLGMRGVEDLGGGLKALFNIETRFDGDTGNQPNARFWHARSIVGMEGGFGRFTLGREYTPAFLMSQLQGDPWGWDTVAAGVTTAITGGGFPPVRNDSALTYHISFSGLTIGAQVAEANDALVNRAKRPMSFAVGYAGGPLAASVALEKPGVSSSQKWTTAHLSYAFGSFKPGVFIGNGTNAAGAKVKSWMASGVVGLGAGELRLALGKRRTGGLTDVNGAAVGYHHNLSKRTTVYVDFARNGELATQKTAYDVGLKHNF